MRSGYLARNKSKSLRIPQARIFIRMEEMIMLKKQNTWIQIFAILFLAVSSAAAYPQPGPRSVYLGSARVDGNFDQDTIRVGRAAGPFRAIQLRVDGGSVRVHWLVVRYGDGSREEVRVHSLIPSGGRTRPIALSRHRRSIQSVDLWYGKAEWRTRPVVSLHGIR
jgi:hypothetical protein